MPAVRPRRRPLATWRHIPRGAALGLDFAQALRPPCGRLYAGLLGLASGTRDDLAPPWCQSLVAPGPTRASRSSRPRIAFRWSRRAPANLLQAYRGFVKRERRRTARKYRTLAYRFAFGACGKPVDSLPLHRGANAFFFSTSHGTVISVLPPPKLRAGFNRYRGEV